MRYNNELKKLNWSASLKIPRAFKELLLVVTGFPLLKDAGALIMRQPLPMVTQGLALNPLCKSWRWGCEPSDSTLTWCPYWIPTKHLLTIKLQSLLSWHPVEHLFSSLDRGCQIPVHLLWGCFCLVSPHRMNNLHSATSAMKHKPETPLISQHSWKFPLYG